MSAHAKLSPSAAHRWMNCPGSVALSEGIPETSSSYADEGTMLHDVIRSLIERRAKPRDVGSTHSFAGMNLDAAQVDEYEELMAQCLGVFWARCDESKGDIALVEKRVQFPGEPDIWGTADVILLGRGRIEVIDWKFGRGVEVEAEDNPQLVIYILAALATFYFLIADESMPALIATIYQPRIGAPKEWAIAHSDAHAWQGAIHQASATTRVHRDRLNDGDWCRFCPAKAICPQLGKTALASLEHEFAILSDYPPEKIAEAVAAIPRIEAWIKAIEAEGLHRAASGGLPGFKIVEGRMGNRDWKDRDAAVRWVSTNVGAKGYDDPKMKSIPALEKIGVKVPENLITRAAGKPHLAPVSDKRPAVAAASLDFEVLETDTDDL